MSRNSKLFNPKLLPEKKSKKLDSIKSLLLSEGKKSKAKNKSISDLIAPLESRLPSRQESLKGWSKWLHENPNKKSILKVPEKTTKSQEYSAELITPIFNPNKRNPLYHSLQPLLIHLKKQMITQLRDQLNSLTSLNPSRRTLLLEHLNRLTETAYASQSGSADPSSEDAHNLPLRQWIQNASHPQRWKALMRYFEEISLFWISQALLLKNWSDRDIRTWNKQDLEQVNWVVASFLKKWVPSHREGWQLTKPNLYSWFKPNSSIIHEAWEIFKKFSFMDREHESDPELIYELILQCYDDPPDWIPFKTFHSNFFQSLWEHTEVIQNNLKQNSQSTFKRLPKIFSPTLRNGSLSRSISNQSHWIGVESYPFLLFHAEILRLWNAPAAPPLWTLGTGLEVFSKDQLQMSWNNPKADLLQQLTEIESCDFAFVFEEKCIRRKGRRSEINYYKINIEKNEEIKKNLSDDSSFGTAQTIVALSKLRPGGLLFLARSEPLSLIEGKKTIEYIFEKSKFLTEWDLTPLKHNLPLQTSYPNFLYLFQREIDPEQRQKNKPLRKKATGSIRSSVELQKFYRDLFTTQTFSTTLGAPWNITSESSNLTQQEWLENWPSTQQDKKKQKIEELYINSKSLNQIANTQTVSLGKLISEFRNDQQSSLESYSDSTLSVWFHTIEKKDSKKIQTGLSSNLDQLLKEYSPNHSVIWITPKFESWAFALKHYLKSQLVFDWFQHFIPTTKGKWNFNEKTLQSLPIPQILIAGMHDFNQLINSLEYKKSFSYFLTEKKIEKNKFFSSCSPSTYFCILSQAYEEIIKSLLKTDKFLTSEDQIQWTEFLKICPTSILVPFTFHHEIKIEGALPPHMPIIQIKRDTHLHQVLRMNTESGHTCLITCKDTNYFEILIQQLKSQSHLTWSELVENVYLPKNIENVRIQAEEIIHHSINTKSRLNEIDQELKNCLKFLHSKS